MKHFKSPHLPPLVAIVGIESVSMFLDGLDQQQIDQAPWHSAGDLPQASFSLAHNSAGLYLKYRVNEPHVLARFTNINDPVYQDSCVEFFIAFGEDAAYYNFEFNSLGTGLIGYGEGKTGRVALEVDVVKQIQTLSTPPQKDTETGFYKWDITLLIPFSVFIYHQSSLLTVKESRVNFYKCGDDLPQPHFLSWAPLNHPYPEFHLPQMFGSVTFA